MANRTLRFGCRSVWVQVFAALGMMASYEPAALGAPADPDIIGQGFIGTPDATIIYDVKKSEVDQRPTTPEEIEYIESRKQQLPVHTVAPLPVRESPTARAIRTAASMAATDSFPLIVILDDQPFDYTRIANLSDDDRQAVIDERIESLRPSQDAAMKALSALGAVEVSRAWLGSNFVAVRLPAAAVRRAAALSFVRSIEWDHQELRPLSTGYDGWQARDYPYVTNLTSHGYTGATGWRGNHTQHGRAGILEADPGPSNHVAYLTSSGTSRVKREVDCSTGTCLDSTSYGTTGSHGNFVTGALAASIEYGQDSAFPGSSTYAQTQRSGTSPFADIYYAYYGGGDSGTEFSSVVAALNWFTAVAADVVNMSWYDPLGHCDPEYGYTVNMALSAATDAGILFVGAAGNTTDSTSSACTMEWPAIRPEVLAVGGLDTYSPAFAYGDLSLDTKAHDPTHSPSTAVGWFPITSTGSVTDVAGGIGLVAPAWRALLPDDGPDFYLSPADPEQGTSFAAPQVAGAALDLRSALYADGATNPLNSSRQLLSMMLAMGDGWNGADVTTAGGSIRSFFGTSRLSGAGRPFYRHPSSTGGMGSTAWWWHDASYLITQGTTTTFEIGNSTAAEPAGITNLKVSVIWTPASYQAVPDVDISIWDECPAGTSASVDQFDYDFRNRLMLGGSDVSGHCLQVRMYGYNVPAGGVTVYASAMYHSDGGP